MSEIEAEVMRRDVNGKPFMAALPALNGLAIVCQRRPDGDWEALYGLCGAFIRDLPHCFSLNSEAKAKLEAAS